MENRSIEINSDELLVLQFARNLIESIYASVLDYKSLIDSNWHYLYCPKDEWAKFCKINIFLLSVRKYIIDQLGDISQISNDGYYHDLYNVIIDNIIEVSTVATTNYNVFIRDVIGKDICYLNGSTDIWYDPYINRIGSREELLYKEEHFLVPLIFTQSGTKPMTSIEMSRKYVDMYDSFNDSDCICIVGFGFNKDDEHINGILRRLIDIDNKTIIVIDLNNGISSDQVKENIVNKLKITNDNNLEVILVDRERTIEGIKWINYIIENYK